MRLQTNLRRSSHDHKFGDVEFMHLKFGKNHSKNLSLRLMIGAIWRICRLFCWFCLKNCSASEYVLLKWEAVHWTGRLAKTNQINFTDDHYAAYSACKQQELNSPQYSECTFMQRQSYKAAISFELYLWMFSKTRLAQRLFCVMKVETDHWIKLNRSVENKDSVQTTPVLPVESYSFLP